MRKLIGTVCIGLGVICFLIFIGYLMIPQNWLPAEEWGTTFGLFLLPTLFFLIIGVILTPIKKEEIRCGRCHQIIPDSIFNVGCPRCDHD
jgi:hypothetical protein